MSLVNSITLWEKYVAKDILEIHKISPIIADSWKYCKENKVNPYQGKGKRLLSIDEFNRKRMNNRLLIDLTKKSVGRLKNYLKNLDFLVVLTDQEGIILWQTGSSATKQEARDIHFNEGNHWTEEMVGTNAIGVALRTGKPNSVRGFEHYAKASQKWSCSAAPIRNEYDQVIGVLDVSLPKHIENHDYFLAAVQLIADAVSVSMKQKSCESQKQLLTYYHTKKQSGIVCNLSNEIVHVSDDLIGQFQDFIGQPIQKWLRQSTIKFIKTPIQREQQTLGYFYYLKAETGERFAFSGVTGTSKQFSDLLHEVEKVAPTKASVHIYGETGSGKEVIARAIHENSACRDGQLVSINCGAIPEELLESELFGYDGGAFTGAKKEGHAGKIENANNGTLFLDEIESMSEKMQISLLRVLQQKELRRVGSKRLISVNFRLVTATNEDLREMVRQGRFREDLFYRIYVYPLHIPSLRQRREDIPYFIHYYQKQNSWRPKWSKSLEQVAQKHSWKGNIRELFNFLERCQIFFTDRSPSDNELEELLMRGCLTVSNLESEALSVKERIEKETIMEALNDSSGKIQQAADRLAISKSTLYRKLTKYKLS